MYTIHILSKYTHKRTSMYQGYYQNDFCIHCGAKFLRSNMNQKYCNRSTGRVAQRIRRPTSNRKIVGSIPIVVNFAMKLNSKKWWYTRRINAASRIRTYAGRSHLISSQTP